MVPQEHWIGDDCVWTFRRHGCYLTYTSHFKYAQFIRVLPWLSFICSLKHVREGLKVRLINLGLVYLSWAKFHSCAVQQLPLFQTTCTHTGGNYATTMMWLVCTFLDSAGRNHQGHEISVHLNLSTWTSWSWGGEQEIRRKGCKSVTMYCVYECQLQ